MYCQRRRVRQAVCAILYTAAAATLTSMPPGQLRAQSSQSSAQVRRENREEMEARQRALRSLGRRLNRPPEKEQVQQQQQQYLYQQSKEDFELLQVVSYRLTNAVGSDSPLDYGGIKKEAAEIRKRAARLKNNLLLPKPEEGGKQKEGEGAVAPGELGRAVAALDVLVKSFVWNPIFHQPGVVDAENPPKARRDLDAIIRLSEQIRKSAEAMSRAAGKNF